MLRNLVNRRLVILFTLTLLASSCFAADVPKNVIMLIGDGMGVGHITAARCAGPGPDGRLAVDTMPITGFVLTHSANNLVTDSAAAGTALATGVKTNNGMVAMTPDGRRLKSILALAMEMGKSAGIISTKSVTDATPAVFVSNVASRGMQEDIAVQMIERSVNVILGGGRGFFLPKSAGGSRSDEQNLLEDARKQGYEVLDTAESLKSTTADRVIGLFAENNMLSKAPEPTLAEMTSKAIELLSANNRSFFLMSEGAKIDTEAHGNNATGVIKETQMFDDAVRVAVDYAKKNGGTLVIVVADHETGGLTVHGPDKDNPVFTTGWTTKGHSANMVPLYAFGPGAELFSGTHDNTEIPRIIAKLWQKELN